MVYVMVYVLYTLLVLVALWATVLAFATVGEMVFGSRTCTRIIDEFFLISMHPKI